MACVEFAYKDNGFFRRSLCDERDQWEILQRIKTKCNNTDIYRSIFTFEDETLERISGPIFFDFDTHNIEGDFENIRRATKHAVMILSELFKTEEVQIFFSGSKGFHVLLDLGLDFTEANGLVKQYKTLAQLIDAHRTSAPNFFDIAIYDKRRIFRVNGTMNSKSGLYKIPITRKELDSLDYESLVRLATQPREMFISPFCVAGYQSKKIWEHLQEEKSDIEIQYEMAKSRQKQMYEYRPRDKFLPCVNHMLETSFPEGSRNNIAIVLASSFLQNGYTVEYTRAELEDWNSRNTPPLPEEEILRTVISANQMIINGKGFGCTRIRELGLCVNCNLGRRYEL